MDTPHSFLFFLLASLVVYLLACKEKNGLKFSFLVEIWHGCSKELSFLLACLLACLLD